MLLSLVVALAPLAYLAIAPSLEQMPVRLDQLAGSRIEYLQDRPGKLTLADVAAGDGNVFHPLGHAADDLALMRLPGPRVNWLRITLPNESPEPVHVVLQFLHSGLDKADVFLAPEDGTASSAAPVAQTGLRLRPAERSLRTHLPAVAVPLPGNRTTTLYVRNPSDSDSPPASIALWRSIDEFRQYEQRQVLPLAIFLGLAAVLFLYHALTGSILREPLTSHFLLYVGATIALVLVASNLSAWLVPGLAGVPREATVLGLLGVAAFGRAHFCRKFLGIGRVLPKADIALEVTLWIIGVATLTAPALFLAPEVLPLATRIISVAAVFAIAAVPLVVAHAAWHGMRHAPLALVAFSCVPAALGWIALGRYGFVAEDRTNGVPLLIGIGLEMLLLGVALTQRHRLAREERDSLLATQATRLQREAADAKGDLLGLAHQLAQLKQDKDRLISMIAHDVRAPLASLVAASRSLPPERAAEHLPAIRRRCTALIELLNNLLDWARLRTGQFAHEPEPVDLATLTDAALRPLESTAVDKAVRLERRIPAHLSARVDRKAVQCLLRNLVGNALKFTATGGTVEVEARLQGNAIELRVQDNGVGMTAEQLARLQSTAASADVPSTPGTAGETGTGVGLALVRELLERNGGTLRLESVLGRGTTATVTLPAETPAPGARSGGGRYARQAEPALR